MTTLGWFSFRGVWRFGMKCCRFLLLFTLFVYTVHIIAAFISISFACRLTSSLLAALLNSLSSNRHFNIASQRSCLSFIVWRIFLQILSSLSANLHLSACFRNLTKYCTTGRSPCVMQSNSLCALHCLRLPLF